MRTKLKNGKHLERELSSLSYLINNYIDIVS